MSSATVPLNETSLRILHELSEQTGLTETEILTRALDDYRRKVFFEGLAADYAALKAKPEEWAEELAERKACEGTLMDGLDPDELWTEDGRCLNPDPSSEKQL